MFAAAYFITVLERSFIYGGMWRYIMSPLHILQSATNYAGTLDTYCRLKAYCCRRQCMPISILFSQANGATICAVNFDTNCRRGQIMPSTLKQLVSKNSTFSFFQNHWANFNQTAQSSLGSKEENGRFQSMTFRNFRKRINLVYLYNNPQNISKIYFSRGLTISNNK